MLAAHLGRYWHLVAVMVLPNSDEKHGFFKSVVARKAAIRFREIPANKMLVLMAGSSPMGTFERPL